MVIPLGISIYKRVGIRESNTHKEEKKKKGSLNSTIIHSQLYFLLYNRRTFLYSFLEKKRIERNVHQMSWFYCELNRNYT